MNAEHSEKPLNGEPIMFIRHAESLTNKAVKDYREKHQLPNCWQSNSSLEGFRSQVMYGPDFCDCVISEKGMQQISSQALTAKEQLKNVKPDLILVSPLQRSLQTFKIIFGDRVEQEGITVIAEPALSQTLKHSSDISSVLSEKQKNFPQVDFSKVKEMGDYWFLKNDTENYEKYLEYLEAFPHCTHQEKQKHIAKFMNLHRMREGNQSIRKRVQTIKKSLSEYSKKYTRIVVVSHHFTIKHMIATKLSPNLEPLDDFHCNNCVIHYARLQDMLKIDK